MIAPASAAVPRVAVGIAVHAEPARFRATLAAVRRTVPSSVHLLAVPNHPDVATAAALAEAAVDVLPPARARGGAASFNRLMAGTDAEVCVLLESGCIPGPGWLERLTAGLAADPRNGLAGPSTNRAWNAQGAEPACAGSEAAVAAAARRLEARHGAATLTLEPLYSLGDFCYAVRREVWHAIGAADEGFGAGPCWEMDYNARAARAGWRGVWIPAAFVWRAPFTPRRAADERRLFEQNRRRYQDRLCGLRLRGESARYEAHCRGDACEHFAPASLIQLRIGPPTLPLPPRGISSGQGSAAPEPAVPEAAAPEAIAPRSAAAGSAPPPSPIPREDRGIGHPPSFPAPPAIAEAKEEDRGIDGRPSAGTAVGEASPPVDAGGTPLISCIMPTRGRPELAMQAVRYFLAQDYPRRELIILDDAGGELGARLPDDPRIRYEQLPPGESIGGKRNRGVELARGDLVAQWDDDDWYAPGRLSAQAAPILEGRADVTALRAEVFFDLGRWEFWTCTDALHRRLFVRDVHGGTLVYRRRLWGGRVRYPRASLAEDAAFLNQAVRSGARLRRVDAPGLFVYLRHGANAWAFACGRHVDPRGWNRVEEPPCLAGDRAFYLARSAAIHPTSPVGSTGSAGWVGMEAPGSAGSMGTANGRIVREAGDELVSCLMPTADRRTFIPRAIEHFLRQTYAARELVIVDDGADPVADLVPDDPRIRYVRASRSGSLGAKRNLACSLARGSLLAHWDDDDWMADHRLEAQVAALRSSGAEACGLATVRYFDPQREKAWEYRWTERARGWVGGNTLLYRRVAWERRPFPPLNEGEDTRWVWSLPTVHAMRDTSWFAALVHARNTSPKQTRGHRWHAIPLDVVRDAMGADWAFYADLASPALTPG